MIHNKNLEYPKERQVNENTDGRKGGEREEREVWRQREREAGRKQGEWEGGKRKNGSDHKKQKSTKTHCTNITSSVVAEYNRNSIKKC